MIVVASTASPGAASGSRACEPARTIRRRGRGVTVRCKAWLWAGGCVLLGCLFVSAAAAAPQAAGGHVAVLQSWVPGGDFASSSLLRVPRYPGRRPHDGARRVLRLAGVRNGRVSAQLAVMAATGLHGLRASVGTLASVQGAVIPADAVQVRYVGYVPVRGHDPRVGGAGIAAVDDGAISGAGADRVIADPLLEQPDIDVPRGAAQPIWFTLHIPAATPPGRYRGAIRIAAEHAQAETYALQLDVADVTLPDPHDRSFRLDAWLNPNAIAGAYRVQPWSAAHWALLQAYFTALAAAGQHTITTAIMQNPWLVAWNGWKPQTAFGYDTMVQWSYDGSRWHFDYRRFDRYVQTALAAGLGPDITAYSLLAFRGPQRITYLDTRSGATVTRRTKAGDAFWTAAWTAFLADFSAHLKRHGWLDHTWLAFDERPAGILAPAMALLKRVAPAFLARTQMAGTAEVGPDARNLSLGLDSLRSVSDAWIQARRARGRITTFYTWSGDAHPNTLTFSPAVEARMMGWIAADRHLDGWLHWAWNDWTADVFRDPVYAFSQGDEYLVYPGPHGPLSSIRWELLQDGIEDDALVRMARQRHAGGASLQQALRLATRNPDGRRKDVRDIVRARAAVIALLAPSSTTRSAP